MSAVDIFKMEMDFDPKTKYTWLYCIVNSITQGVLIQGFIRDMNEEEITNFVVPFGYVVKKETLIPFVEVKILYQCGATQGVFEELFNEFREYHLESDNYASMAFHLYKEPIVISGREL